MQYYAGSFLRNDDFAFLSSASCSPFLSFISVLVELDYLLKEYGDYLLKEDGVEMTII